MIPKTLLDCSLGLMRGCVLATHPRRASWATFVAVHIVVQLQTAEMALLVWCTWYTKLVQITHSVLIQHLYIQEQICCTAACANPLSPVFIGRSKKLI